MLFNYYKNVMEWNESSRLGSALIFLNLDLNIQTISFLRIIEIERVADSSTCCSVIAVKGTVAATPALLTRKWIGRSVGSAFSSVARVPSHDLKSHCIGTIRPFGPLRDEIKWSKQEGNWFYALLQRL